MQYKCKNYIIKFLEDQGIEYIAGIPGSANLPLYDTLSKSGIQHILARHEQGAGFIAGGMARSTGKPSVCLATSGPGTTNLTTAIADAYLDSVPVIAITGQVSSNLMGTSAFQEIDTLSIFTSITKKCYSVKSAQDIQRILHEAFCISVEGRPGPVVIDIPKNVLNETIEISCVPQIITNDVQSADYNKINAMASIINKSLRPLIIAGGGIITGKASEFLTELAEKNSIPVATSLMGLGAFPGVHPLFIGMPGMHGGTANVIMKNADLIIALGTRFNDRTTGRIEDFCPHASIIHIDIDASEFNKNIKCNLAVQGNLTDIIQNLLPDINTNDRDEWINCINDIKNIYGTAYDIRDNLHPSNIIKRINEAASDAIITTDVGQHQMWTAQSYAFKRPRTFLTSGGLGAMGFGLPTAIGASLANPGENVICISGDGSILMNIQELATLAELNLPVKIFIMNNNNLGLVRQQQEMFYNANIFASGFSMNPDFAKISENFGIKSFDLSNDIENGIKKALSNKGPCLVNIPVNPKYNVLPIVPPGEANHNMIGLPAGIAS